MSASFLEQYDALDVIGNGSFGIIRKVRRKSDGIIFARKELNFERMNERDRKQIVAEVNILKDLHHDHIVRYHDRHVDRDAGILYILMEYCGGGDLSSVIKQAIKHDRLVPEDTIWNYFLQILLALQHCHHPNGHGRSGSGISTGLASVSEADSKEKRAQILHRDLKPDNVFLDENHTVKLGDFGLSKALPQAAFANTYVGTPYYMSPELMQEKAYDSKSDIWSLGCLIYELCALKPPFHEAKTHAELSILIRNGRIPPLPKGYSQALGAVIKSMLNLNPAMRPSVMQLLQHERLEFALKVIDTEKMLQTVKNHKSTIISREKAVAVREQALLEREQQISSLIAQKENEISVLQQALQAAQASIEHAIKEAITKREDELRTLVTRREQEVATAIARREEEIIASVNQREADLCKAWEIREEQIRQEFEGKTQWVHHREQELLEEEARLQQARVALEEKAKIYEDRMAKGRRDKPALEEIKNILDPLTTPDGESRGRNGIKQRAGSSPPKPLPSANVPSSFATPLVQHKTWNPPSAMKGVIMTTTGEALSTPAPGALTTVFVNSPKVGLNFTKIFDSPTNAQVVDSDEDDAPSPPPSPSSRVEKRRETYPQQDQSCQESSSGTDHSSTSSNIPPTRIRRPSIRNPRRSNAMTPSSTSDPSATSVSVSAVQPKPLPHPHLQPSSAPRIHAAPLQRLPGAPGYDFLDEENLPSPFLKRVERVGGSHTLTKRPSNGSTLRAVAAANSAGRRGKSISHPGEYVTIASPVESVINAARPAVSSTRKVSEEEKKIPSRP